MATLKSSGALPENVNYAVKNSPGQFPRIRAGSFRQAQRTKHEGKEVRGRSEVCRKSRRSRVGVLSGRAGMLPVQISGTAARRPSRFLLQCLRAVVSPSVISTLTDYFLHAAVK